MTYFLNLRTRSVAGPVNPNPQLYEGDGTTPAAKWSLIAPRDIPAKLAGKSVLFATHGFNVTQSEGVLSLGTLDKYLNLTSPGLLVGVLWPGDSYIPIVDYPFEGDVAIECGQRLAAFCNECCPSAQALSFVSHSLGARLILQAVGGLARKAQSVCLTAAAINRDSLTTEYAVAAQNALSISILASREDDVLKIAFSIGDPFADLLNDDHAPFELALGYEGPPLPQPEQVRPPWQISDKDDYGHSDYLPPSSPKKWPRAADFMKRAYFGQPQPWPSLSR